MLTRETIYKRTKAGKIQIWYGELEGNKYRTVSGQEDGKKVVSEWTICEGKNIGRSNETSPIEQAAFELDALYRKKLEREYRRSKEDVDIKLYTKPLKCLKWYEDAHKRPSPGTKIGVQPKYDGMRCLISAAGAKSQDGKIIPGAQYIFEDLQEVFKKYPTLELDGELYNHDFKEDFEGLMSLFKKELKTEEIRNKARELVQYHIYDVVLNIPYWTEDGKGRYQFLRGLETEFFSKYHNKQRFYISPMVITEMDSDGKVVEDIDDDNIENGYEGSVVRVLTDKGYVPGDRPRTMFKVKNFQDDEFPIVEILEGKGNWSGHAKAIRILLPNGNICKASVKGDKAYAKRLLEKKNELVNKMATVKYLRYSKKGMLNLPIFKSVRWDV